MRCVPWITSMSARGQRSNSPSLMPVSPSSRTISMSRSLPAAFSRVAISWRESVSSAFFRCRGTLALAGDFLPASRAATLETCSIALEQRRENGAFESGLPDRDSVPSSKPLVKWFNARASSASGSVSPTVSAERRQDSLDSVAIELDRLDAHALCFAVAEIVVKERRARSPRHSERLTVAADGEIRTPDQPLTRRLLYP